MIHDDGLLCGRRGATGDRIVLWQRHIQQLLSFGLVWYVLVWFGLLSFCVFLSFEARCLVVILVKVGINNIHF
jgi:hypothetical protein